MEKYISIEKFIREAKKKGVDFGKGDPYNRIRYYTKIGWLPHTVRMQDSKGNVTGHYPKWALDHIILIEELKEKGYSNDEITSKLSTKNKIVRALELVRSKDTRNQIIAYASFLIIILILLSEFGIIKVGQPKTLLLNNNFDQTVTQILDSGDAFVPEGASSIEVPTSSVTNNAKVYVTFNQDYTPATRFWVESINDFESFTLMLDAPVSTNAGFSWWVSN